ncbi:hypothetical protein O6H91_12G024500 [Diphasiastrum complanatum]|uniref:Uncharacterized protein n=2 Tax=Diphasiastrum complanatum TaxID=34168 RepID=A0ACC2C0T9_DIPCM|nr:hypothetical protein O6H91_12G024500 [Diphasiastrum complanatum]KAJ7535247.1 hypothetical protein O6H91_12G024500 [Diphasiastrum complanatum]
MSTRRGGTSKGPPKHQNHTAWKPNAGVKTKDKELGGKQHPYPEITGVCLRCKEKIEWKRKYGKYKPLTEAAKCHQCAKRAVRQAYHALCSACAKDRGVCAKCCHLSVSLVGRDAEEKENEKQQLQDAIRNLRERDRRTLLRAMDKGSHITVKQSALTSIKPEDSDESGTDAKKVDDKEIEISESEYESDDSD